MDKEKYQQLSEPELRDEERKLQEQVFKLRIQKVKGQLENAQRLTMVRRDLARIKTAIRLRELAAARATEEA